MTDELYANLSDERKKLAADFIALSEKVRALSNVLNQKPQDTINDEIIDFLWDSQDTITELVVLRQKAIEALERPNPAASQRRQYFLDSTVKEITDGFTEAFGDVL